MTEGRFLGASMNIWSGISGLAALIGVIALLAGGAFGVFEYLDRKASARAAETLRMIEIWETRGAHDAYLSLSRALEDGLRATPASERRDASRADTLRDNLARRAIRAHPGSYDSVVAYFTRMSLCIEARLCSAPVAATFFDATLADFRTWFSGEISRRRDLTPSHAVELDRLSALFAAQSGPGT